MAPATSSPAPRAARAALRAGATLFRCTVLLLLVQQVFVPDLPAQRILNGYAKVLEYDLCHNRVLIASREGFASGDRVLLLQMKGASMLETNSSAYGAILEYGHAGDFEFATIDSIAPTGQPWVRFRNHLLTALDAAEDVQMIRVVSAPNVTISDTVTAPSWSEMTGTGGVVVIEAKGGITITGAIDVSAKGFAGGGMSMSSSVSDVMDYYTSLTSGNAGGKGEGIARFGIAAEAGRGALANGGGGGNALNAGGGGGANFGAGGIGGDEVSSAGGKSIGGLGGHALDYSPTKVFAGGGGGGGHQNDGNGTRGGNGGGIIILRAPSISGSGILNANGESAAMAAGDGAGGGGAGGTVYIDAAQIGGALAVEVKGGNGGDAMAAGSTYCYAPGGGGGGGAMLTSGVHLGAQLAFAGGKAGTVRSSSDGSCNGTSYGALDGMSGAAGSASRTIEGTVRMLYPHVAESELTVCEGETTLLEAVNGVAYEWSPAMGLSDPRSANPTASPKVTTMYRVAIDHGDCIFTDSVVVHVVPKPRATISGSDFVCAGSTTSYAASADSGVAYRWRVTGGTVTRDEDTAISVSWPAQGSGSVTLIAKNAFCADSTTLTVTIGDKVVPVIIGDSTICGSDSVTLSTRDAYAHYLWSTGDTSATIRVGSAGEYSVTVANDGCSGSSTPVRVVQHAKPLVTIGLSKPMLDSAGDSLMLSVSGFAAYLWSTGSTGSSIVVHDSGMYTVTVVDATGCTGSASVHVDRAPDAPTLALAVDDISAAPGETVDLPIRLTEVSGVRSAGAFRLMYDLVFNKTLLVPQSAVASRDSGELRIATFASDVTPVTTTGVLQTVRFLAALGDASATPVAIENVRSVDGRRLRVSTGASRFTLKNICPAGGERLFSLRGALVLNRIFPNPAQNTIEVEYGTPEDGRVRLTLYDMLGVSTATLVDEEVRAGVFRGTFNISRVPAGRYFLVLSTPTETLHQSLEVVR